MSLKILKKIKRYFAFNS